MEEKKIRFNSKHVDESWKEQISKEREPKAKESPRASSGFATLVSSLGVQAMMQLGIIGEEEQKVEEPNFQGAQEIIDLLLMLKEKTNGNLTAEEGRLITSLIADLQLKFVQLQK